MLVADLGGDAVGGALGRQRVQPEALGRRVPHARALEEFKRAHATGQRLHDLGAEQLHGGDDGVHPHARALRLVGDAQHGDDQRDIRLDGRDDVGRRDVVAGHHREQAVARLGERGEGLERLKGHRQTAAVPLVLMARAGSRGGSAGAAL